MSEHAKRMKRELVMKGTILDVYKDMCILHIIDRLF